MRIIDWKNLPSEARERIDREAGDRRRIMGRVRLKRRDDGKVYGSRHAPYRKH